MLRPGIEETEENLTNLMESRLEVSTHVRGASLNFSVVATEYIRFLSSVLALKEISNEFDAVFELPPTCAHAVPSSSPQDHERIRGGLFFLESIPRDENWKVLKEALKEYKSIKEEREEEVIYDEYFPEKQLT